MKTEWQPIETAPRDGTPILAFYPEGGGECRDYSDSPGMAVVWWPMDHPGHADPKLQNNDAMWKGYYSAVGPSGPVTHWMPLPEPPNAD